MLTDEQIDDLVDGLEHWDAEGQTWRADTDVIMLAAQAREANALRAQLAEALAEIQNLLGSAVPNNRDHPSMFAAWKRADAFLGSRQPGKESLAEVRARHGFRQPTADERAEQLTENLATVDGGGEAVKALDIECTQCGAVPGVACPFPIPGGYAGVYDYAHRVRVDEAHRLTLPTEARASTR